MEAEPCLACVVAQETVRLCSVVDRSSSVFDWGGLYEVILSKSKACKLYKKYKAVGTTVMDHF